MLFGSFGKYHYSISVSGKLPRHCLPALKAINPLSSCSWGASCWHLAKTQPNQTLFKLLTLSVRCSTLSLERRTSDLCPRCPALQHKWINSGKRQSRSIQRGNPICLSCHCSNCSWLLRRENTDMHFCSLSFGLGLQRLSGPLTSNMIRLWEEVWVGILTHSSWRQRSDQSELNIWANYKPLQFQNPCFLTVKQKNTN